jgi:hypothetical protein
MISVQQILRSNVPGDSSIIAVPHGIRPHRQKSSAVVEHCISLDHRVVLINTIILEKTCWCRNRITGKGERSSFTLPSWRGATDCSQPAGRTSPFALREGTDAKKFLLKAEDSSAWYDSPLPGPKKGVFAFSIFVSYWCGQESYRFSPFPWSLVTYPHPVRLAWPHLHLTKVGPEDGNSIFRKFDTHLRDFMVSQTIKIMVEIACILPSLWTLYNVFSWSSIMSKLHKK